MDCYAPKFSACENRWLAVHQNSFLAAKSLACDKSTGLLCTRILGLRQIFSAPRNSWPVPKILKMTGILARYQNTLNLQISQAPIIELTENVEGLKSAFVVLSKHQLGAFPQLTIDFLSLSSHVHNPTGDELDHVSSWIAMHQSSRLVKINGLPCTKIVGLRQNQWLAPNLLARAKILGLY